RADGPAAGPRRGPGGAPRGGDQALVAGPGGCALVGTAGAGGLVPSRPRAPKPVVGPSGQDPTGRRLRAPGAGHPPRPGCPLRLPGRPAAEADAEAALAAMAAVSDDAAFPGYPYPLTVADRLAACPGWLREEAWMEIEEAL